MGTKLAAYRNEIARQFDVIDGLEAEVKELRDVEARLRARLAVERAGTGSCHMEHGTCVHAKNAIRLEAALVQTGRERDEAIRERDALKRLLRRYESAAVPGQNGYNEARARARKKLAKRAAEEAGEEYVENHIVGPPENHRGHHCGFDISRVEWREHEKCPKCGGRVKQRKIYTKIIIDFEGDSRFITVVLYKGHAARCDTCRRTFKPKFPSIGGTSFGMEVLSFILEYAGRRSTDGDIAYYMERLYRYLCSINSVWNARQAIARVLEPAVERIKEELKKAPFLMLDETTYRYRKKRIYVWVVRTDTATMVVPAMGPGRNTRARLPGGAEPHTGGGGRVFGVHRHVPRQAAVLGAHTAEGRRDVHKVQGRGAPEGVLGPVLQPERHAHQGQADSGGHRA